MKGTITELEFEVASSLIIDLIKDENKQEVDFSSTSLSPCNIDYILEELGIKKKGRPWTENVEDFYVAYEGGLVLCYNAWLFVCILMKGSDYDGTIQDTKAENN
jgi:hypothetical protein